MAETIENAWTETQELTSPVDMSRRFWAFRAFYGILTAEQQERYLNNVRDMKARETHFRQVWLATINPKAMAREVICHYSAVLGYHPNHAQTNQEIADAWMFGSREYAFQTRPERERVESLNRVAIK
jgi:hypothetical protein